MKCTACPSEKIFAVGLCRGCYDRRRRRGTTERKNVSNLGACSVEGCDRQSFAKNLCCLHYQRDRHPLNATWRNLRKRWPGEFPDGWRKFEVFLADVGERPDPKAQLRRRDHAAPWSKGNAIWSLPVAPRSSISAKDYSRRWDLRKKYGITVEQVEAMAKAHVTRAVRGLLCDPCNKALGLMQDDPARLRAAAEYLERHNAA